MSGNGNGLKEFQDKTLFRSSYFDDTFNIWMGYEMK